MAKRLAETGNAAEATVWKRRAGERHIVGQRVAQLQPDESACAANAEKARNAKETSHRAAFAK